MRARAERVVIPLAALLAVLPMLLNGPSCGHDFDFHLLSWLEASRQFAQLHYPHWAYTPAWNAGEPRFLFYPPISWSLGAVLGLALPWKLVPAAFTFICLTLSGFTAYRLASRYASAGAAMLAAVLYLTNPYMLFTAYERTAYGELLAAAWLPLLFLAALAPRVRMVPLALPVALLWLTNAPAAVMGCYALAFVTVVRLAIRRGHERPAPAERTAGSARVHLAVTTVAATILGLALSAFYLLPAAYERQYIQSEMATVEGMRIGDNTLFHHMPATEDNAAHDAVLHTASLIALGMLAMIAITLVARRKQAAGGGALAPLALLSVLIAVLLTRMSLAVWAHTPELRFLQFPWRLTAILATILAVTAAQALDRLKLRPVRARAVAFVVAAALVVPGWHFFHLVCDGEDSVPARVALFHSNQGTEPTDEYTPTTADNDSLKDLDPPYWVVPATDAQPDEAINAPAPGDRPPGPAPEHLVLTVAAPEFLILNLRQFPDWQLTLNGHAAAPYGVVRDDGLVTLALPVGQDTVDIAYHRPLDQDAGIGLSAIAGVVTLALARRKAAAVADAAG